MSVASGTCRRLREDLSTVVEDALFPWAATDPPAEMTGRASDALRAHFKPLAARLVQSKAFAHNLASSEQEMVRPLDKAGGLILTEFRRVNEAHLSHAVAKRFHHDHRLLADAFIRGARVAYRPPARY